MRDLSPTAQEAVGELLGNETLADMSAWADWVRDDRPETAPLHYINGPRDRLGPSEPDYHLERGNVYLAVLGYAERLADVGLPHHERAEALKFFIHFIGDLHQPLHCGFADDRGGNDFVVIYQGEPANLHRYWDRDVLEPRFDSYSSAEYAAILFDRYSDHQRATWAGQGNPRDWVVEARALIFNGLYPVPRADGTSGDPVAVLDESYRDVWLPAAERQLARAGARAAAALNELFESGTSPFDSPPIPFPPAPAR